MRDLVGEQVPPQLDHPGQLASVLGGTQIRHYETNSQRVTDLIQWGLPCVILEVDISAVTTPEPPVAPGAFVSVRHRRWLVESVAAPVSAGDAHSVSLTCIDDDAVGDKADVLWELEPDADLIPASPWEALKPETFDSRDRFGAFYRTYRWGCVTATDPGLLQAPFRAGIQIEPYQMEPLRKALLMPRVNQLIADDVGLGKTVEAGLILRELLLRRRAERCVITAPPGMLNQWQEEMEARFGLHFTIFDRSYVASVRARQGYGTNAWETGSFFLISHRLLTEDRYLDGLNSWLGDFCAKSVLILDEAHHAAPASGAVIAIDSDFTHSIRGLAPRFEHRVFLSATPHNGHSNSFSALLEILDPQRFTRRIAITKSNRDAVMVRRLKEDIREVQGGFPRRQVEQIDITDLPVDAPELVLSQELAKLRELREQRLSAGPRWARQAGLLVLGTLQQRLLSSMAAFRRTIGVHAHALDRALASSPILLPRQERLLLQAAGQDDEAESQEAEQDEAVERATGASSSGPAELLAREREIVGRMHQLAECALDGPDPRVAWLLDWIGQHMCPGLKDQWTDRRLLIFTEWEDTRRWLEQKLVAAIANTDEGARRIAAFTGLTPPKTRDRLQLVFNLPPERDPLRILIATDAAREGLNFQRSCHDLLHFDLPWNPSRLEQRNGRIDRKLQPAPAVTCRYFFFPQRAEDRVLQVLVRKSDTIRKELGSVAAVLEARIKGLLQSGIRHTEIASLATQIQSLSGGPGAATAQTELEESRERQDALLAQIARINRQLERSAKPINFSSDRLREAISVALLLAGIGPLELVAPAGLNHPASYRLPLALAADSSWLPILDLLRPSREAGVTVPQWQATVPPRPVTFSDPGTLGQDVVQLHLEHPLVRRLLARFTTQGLVHLDLSRACLATTRLGEPRVILLGRLSLYGPGAVRLHEAILPVTARWVEPSLRQTPIVPFGESGTETALDRLEDALSAPEHPLADEVRNRLLAAIPRDIDELRPHFERAAETAQAEAEAQLTARGERESSEMLRLISEQRVRIEAALAKAEPIEQLSLKFPDEAAREAAQRQVLNDRRAWDARLTKLGQEAADLPARIRDGYRVQAARVEPIGIAYLWPAAA